MRFSNHISFSSSSRNGVCPVAGDDFIDSTEALFVSAGRFMSIPTAPFFCTCHKVIRIRTTIKSKPAVRSNIYNCYIDINLQTFALLYFLHFLAVGLLFIVVLILITLWQVQKKGAV